MKQFASVVNKSLKNCFCSHKLCCFLECIFKKHIHACV